MGRPTPPLPLSRAEIDRRIANGARTFEEIDPEFSRWVKSQQLSLLLMGLILILTLLVCGPVLLYCVWVNSIK